LKKKHKRLESELASHEPAIQAVQDAGQQLMNVSNLGVPEIEQRLRMLNQVGTLVLLYLSLVGTTYL
jgi:spectrin alpha